MVMSRVIFNPSDPLRSSFQLTRTEAKRSFQYVSLCKLNIESRRVHTGRHLGKSFHVILVQKTAAGLRIDGCSQNPSPQMFSIVHLWYDSVLHLSPFQGAISQRLICNQVEPQQVAGFISLRRSEIGSSFVTQHELNTTDRSIDR